MESTSEKGSVRKYSRGVMEAVHLRLRDRVPYEDADNPTSVEGLLHRLTSVDFVTGRRFKGLARRVAQLSNGAVLYVGGLELVAHALGYTSYKSAWLTMIDGRITNVRKEKRNVVKHQEATSGR